MHTTRLLLILLFFTGLNAAIAAPGSDRAKEKRWEEQIVDSLLVGEAVKLPLKNSKETFLGIYAEHTAEKAQGGVILMHGIGAHPNWPDIIYPLRTRLPEYGWNTLSIQMPILANDAPYADYAPLFDEAPERIDAAIAFLKSKGINNIAIVAHSLGAAMASYYLSIRPKAGIRTFIGIGMGRTDVDPRMDNPTSLAKITIPVLDLYGAQDLQQVMLSVERRANAGSKAGNKNYFQLRVAGANHFFHDLDDLLVNRVRGWFARHAAGQEIRTK